MPSFPFPQPTASPDTPAYRDYLRATKPVRLEAVDASLAIVRDSASTQNRWPTGSHEDCCRKATEPHFLEGKETMKGISLESPAQRLGKMWFTLGSRGTVAMRNGV